MAITPNKAAIEAAGFDYIEPTELIKDAPSGLNRVTQAVVDLMAKPKADALVTALHRGARNDGWDELYQKDNIGLWAYAKSSPEPRPNPDSRGSLWVAANGAAGSYQILTDADTGQMWARTYRSGSFGPWRPLVGSESASGVGTSAALANRVREEDFRRRVGPVKVTAKAAVALRFDHGLTNFASDLLPILRQHGFRSTVAMNARLWGEAENSAITPATADSWTDVEFANHSASHEDASGYDGLYDQIVAGRDELQAQLPKHRIDGFVVPGVGGGQWGGFTTGNSAAGWATTAGQLIAGSHAWSTGHMPSSRYRPLDGVIRLGEAHRTYETWDLATFQTSIDEAVATETGLALMMHPRVLNVAGYLTTDLFAQMMAWLKTRVDAGDVQIVTLGELAVASR